MAELKTKKNNASVDAFLECVADEARRADAIRVMKLMRRITGAKPKMWGGSIIGFGDYRCKYPSGRELDWFIAGFSPRKANLTLYLMSGFDGQERLLKQLGKHKTGKACLYIKRLADIDLAALGELIQASVAHASGRNKK